MPLLTVIIPVHNRAKLIGATLDSVLEQPAHDGEVEMIVVDDGSTDGSADVVRQRYTSRGVRLITQANGGPAAARNAGIPVATGRYIVFLDSDDLWLPWTLQLYRDVIGQFNKPSYVMTVPHEFEGSLASISGLSTALVADHYRDYYTACRLGLFTGTSAFLVRTDVLRSIGGFADPNPPLWLAYEDIDLGMRLGTASDFVHVRSPPAFGYRRHFGSASGMHERTYAGSLFMIQQENTGAYPGGPERRRERLELLGRHLRPVVVACAQNGTLIETFRLYRLTFRWNLQMHRWKFLAVLPPIALWHAAKRFFGLRSK